MVKIFTPDENLQGIQGGLDDTLLGPSKANIQSADNLIQRSQANNQATSSILSSRNQLQAVKDRDRANFVAGARQAKQAAAQRDALVQKETQGAEDTIEYGKAYADATLQLAEAIDKRQSIKLDEKGNPTYGTYVADVGKLATRIQGAASGKILSKAAREKFNSTFYSQVISSQIEAFKVARADKLDYLDSTLQNNMTKLQSAGIKGSETQSASAVLAIESLATEAKRQGLDATKVDNYLNAARQGIGEGKLTALIQAGQYDAAENLMKSHTPEQLFTSDDFYINTRIKIAKARADIQDQTVASAKLDITNQKLVSKSEVEKITQNLPKAKALEVITHFNTVNKDQLEIDRAANEMQTRLDSGAKLQLTDSKIVATDYARRLKDMTTPEKTPTLFDEATLAAKYTGAPVKPFQEKLESIHKYGTPEQKIQAVAAFEIAQGLNPESISGMDTETYNAIGMMKEISRNGAVPADVMEKKIEARLGRSSEDVKGSRSNFRSKYISKNPQYIDTALRSAVGASSLANYVGIGNVPIDPEVRAEFASSVQDYYAMNGENFEAAVISANAEGGVNRGISNFGGVARIVRFPIEKMPGLSGYPLPVLERALSIELGKNNLDDDVSKYRLLPTNKTRGTFDVNTKEEIIQYRLAKQEGDTLVAIKDENGKYFTWAPTQEELKISTGSFYEEQKYANMKAKQLDSNPFSVNTRFGKEDN